MLGWMGMLVFVALTIALFWALLGDRRAERRWLDGRAMDVGLLRRPGESDASLRRRVAAVFEAPPRDGRGMTGEAGDWFR